jgi:tRNA G46 methylase TrmB
MSAFTDTVIEVNKLEILRRINFKKRFNNQNPIKLEVCSGHGEWVVERAF